MRKTKLSFTVTWPNHVKKYININVGNKQGTGQRKCCENAASRALYQMHVVADFVVRSLAYCLQKESLTKIYINVTEHTLICARSATIRVTARVLIRH